MRRNQQPAERVNAFTAKHVAYAEERVAAPDGTIARTQRNCGTSTLAIWIKARKFSERQLEGVACYARAKALSSHSPNITAPLGPTAGIHSTSSNESERRIREILAARSTASHLDKVLLERLERPALEVFRGIVLDGETALEAGKRIGQSGKQAQGAVLATVRIVAGMIANELKL
jgi:hypothetical protein